MTFPICKRLDTSTKTAGDLDRRNYTFVLTLKICVSLLSFSVVSFAQLEIDPPVRPASLHARLLSSDQVAVVVLLGFRGLHATKQYGMAGIYTLRVID